MPKNRDFAPLDPLPANWTDSLEEFVSQQAAGLQIIPKAGTNATVLQVPIPLGYVQVTVGMEGRWRWITAPVERAVPTGVARWVDLWLTATGNQFAAGDPGEVDLTDPAFALFVTETGVEPAGAPLKRLVGRAQWDGTRVVAIDMYVGAAATTARGAAGGVLTGRYPDPGLADGVITNAKVAAGAAIDPAKVAGTAVVDADQRLVPYSGGVYRPASSIYVAGASGTYDAPTTTTAGIALLSTGRVNLFPSAASGYVLASQVAGEAFARWALGYNGAMEWGPGNAARDTQLGRLSPNALRTPGYFIAGAGAGPANSGVNLNPAGRLEVYGDAASGAYILMGQKGDAVGRFVAYATGLMEWGDGTNPRDVTLQRPFAGQLQTNGALRYVRPAANSTIIDTVVTGDAAARYTVLADGTTRWGPGSVAYDVSLNRSAAGVLAVTGALSVSGGITQQALTTSASAAITMRAVGDTQDRFIVRADGLLRWGSGTAAVDTILSRASGGQLQLTGGLTTTGNVTLAGGASFVARNAAAVADLLVALRVAGDSQDRLRVEADGTHRWSSGAAAADTTLTRSAAGILTVGGGFDLVKAAGLLALMARRTGDAAARFGIDTDGGMGWGVGDGVTPWPVSLTPNPAGGKLGLAGTLDATGLQVGGYSVAAERDILTPGLLSARPSAAGRAGRTYFATNVNGGTIYQSDGTNWLERGQPKAGDIKDATFPFHNGGSDNPLFSGSPVPWQGPLTSGASGTPANQPTLLQVTSPAGAAADEIWEARLLLVFDIAAIASAFTITASIYDYNTGTSIAEIPVQVATAASNGTLAQVNPSQRFSVPAATSRTLALRLSFGSNASNQLRVLRNTGYFYAERKRIVAP